MSDPLSVLKEWMVKGGGRSKSTKTIAEKIGIPLRRMKRALQGKDDLAEHHMLILTFLMKEGVMKAEQTIEQAEQATHSHASFVPLTSLMLSKANEDDRSHAMLIRTRRIQRLEDSHVFCQISERDIETNECMAIQGGQQCFGCGATSRFCRTCQIRFVASPFVDMCSICCEQEQTAEDQAAQHGRPPIHPFQPVYCHLMKQDILQDACRTLQSTQCGTCNASSRLCTSCKLRRVYYAEYGLCLACTRNEYSSAEDAAPYSDDEIKLLEHMRQAKTHQSSDDEQTSLSTTTDVKSEPEQAQHDMPEQANEQIDDDVNTNEEQAEKLSETEEEETASQQPHPNDLTKAFPDDFGDAFYAYLQTQGMKERTTSKYRDYAISFFSMLNKRGLSLDSIEHTVCEEFVLTDEYGLLRGRSDVGVRLSALKKLFDWLTYQHQIDLPILNITIPENKEKETITGTAYLVSTAEQPKNTEPEPAKQPAKDTDDLIGHYEVLIDRAHAQGNTMLAEALTRARSLKETAHAHNA